MSALSDKLIEIASGEIGTKEQGNNSGERVNEYQACVGGHAGDSWCMCFVQWCIEQAEAALGTKLDLKRTESVMQFWNAMKPYQTQEPAPGMIMIMDHAQTPLGHTGIVTDAPGDGTVRTIEGNTGQGGGREGDGVYAKVRNLEGPKDALHIIGFIDVSSIPEVSFT